MEKTAFVALMSALLLGAETIFARCLDVKIQDYNGTYTVAKIEQASFPCGIIEGVQGDHPRRLFPFEGCFIDFNVPGKKNETIKVYDDSRNCRLQVGDKLRLHVRTAECCEQAIDLIPHCRLKPRPEITAGPQTKEEIACYSDRSLLLPY
jgi:hypothetical protein